VIRDLREERREPDPFSLDEVTTLLTDGVQTGWKRRYFEVASFTGLRPPEQIGLQWSDVDWPRKLICVRRGVGRFGEGKTKTEGSLREVHMLPRVQGVLKAQRAVTDERSVWVFPNDRGGALNITNLRKRVWRLRTPAGRPPPADDVPDPPHIRHVGPVERGSPRLGLEDAWTSNDPVGDPALSQVRPEPHPPGPGTRSRALDKWLRPR
jgi:integrase